MPSPQGDHAPKGHGVRLALGGWYVVSVVCRACGHEWIGVVPEEAPLTRLECGACHAQDSIAVVCPPPGSEP